MDDANAKPGEALRFDEALPREGDEGTSVSCSSCGTKLTGTYYALADAPWCARCRGMLEVRAKESQSMPAFMKAVALGLLAAILGAALYYAVIALTNFEIGIVAIAIGFMVGYAVRHVTKGYGGRRYQLLAAGLTYFAVGMAYTPLAIKGFIENRTTSDSAAIAGQKPEAAGRLDSGTTSLTDSARASGVRVDTDAAASNTGVGILLAIGMSIFFMAALPVLTVISSLPGGLISAAIIAFGMQQAWKMSGAPDLTFTGPHRIGGAPPSPNAA